MSGEEVTVFREGARCARTSYNNHDGTRTSLERDLDLANWLRQNRHMSPFEHQACAAAGEQHANFRDWQSYRRKIEIEADRPLTAEQEAANV